MTDLRARLADALQFHLGEYGLLHGGKALDTYLADVLLSLPGIAIVDTSGEQIPLANGQDVPLQLVAKLNEFDRRWPGATLPQARPAVVAALLAAANTAEQQKGGLHETTTYPQD